MTADHAVVDACRLLRLLLVRVGLLPRRKPHVVGGCVRHLLRAPRLERVDVRQRPDVQGS